MTRPQGNIFLFVVQRSDYFLENVLVFQPFFTYPFLFLSPYAGDSKGTLGKFFSCNSLTPPQSKSNNFRCGFVEFFDEAPVNEAAKLNGMIVKGRPMRVDFSAPRPSSLK